MSIRVAGDARCAAAAGSPLRVRKADGSLAQQIRRAAAAAEAEDLEELRRGLRSDVLAARRLLEEQRKAEERQNQEQAELRDCVASCREEAAAASADAKDRWLRFEAAAEAVTKGYREGDQKLGSDLLLKMSELNAKLGENMAALEAEVTENVHLEIASLRKELDKRLSSSFAEALETKCSGLLKQAEASLSTSLSEASEASKKALRTSRKEHEAFVLRRQKQLGGWVQECQDQLREVRDQCGHLEASTLAKVEALQVQEQRRWSGQLDSRLGRCEGECQALLSDARQHLGASEEMLQSLRRDGEAQQQDLRESVADLGSRMDQATEAATARENELRSLRASVEHLATSFQAMEDRMVVVESAVSKHSTSVQSLRHKLSTCKENTTSQYKELQQQITAEVSELRRTQAESESKQVSAMEEQQQALRRHCRAWSAEAAQSVEEAMTTKLHEVAKRCENATSQAQAQCRDWVDTALARLETLAVRTREQLVAFAEELPFTVRRVLSEELGKAAPKAPAKGRRISRPSPGVREMPLAPPFELGEPLALPLPAESSLRLTTSTQLPTVASTPVHQAAAATISTPSGKGVVSPPHTPSAEGFRSGPDLDRSELHDISFSPHAAG